MISFRYGVLEVLNLPGSEDAVLDNTRLASAQSDTLITESGLIPLSKDFR
jgi:hypothetical protein